jgi:hypothetical protein
VENARIADFSTVKDVQFGMQALHLAAVAVILQRMLAGQMTSIAGLAGSMMESIVQ